jgi:hypothetical protein
MTTVLCMCVVRACVFFFFFFCLLFVLVNVGVCQFALFVQVSL